MFDVMYVFLWDGCGYGGGGGDLQVRLHVSLYSESRSYVAHIVSIHYINQISLSFDIFNRCMYSNAWVDQNKSNVLRSLSLV